MVFLCKEDIEHMVQEAEKYKAKDKQWDKVSSKNLLESCAFNVKATIIGTSLTVQWLRLHASTAGGMGSIPGRRTKILHTTQFSQEIKKINKQNKTATTKHMKATVEDEKLQGKINDEDKQKCLDKCNEIINWLDENQAAEKEESEHQQKELESLQTPSLLSCTECRRHARRNAWGLPWWWSCSIWWCLPGVRHRRGRLRQPEHRLSIVPHKASKDLNL